MNTRHGIVVSDERAAALYTPLDEPGGGWRLEERGRLRNAHEQGHERGRPTLLGRGTPTGPQHLVSAGHTAEEETRRFAREIVRWVDESAGTLALQRLTVFAPPRLLGVLRAEQGRRDLDLRPAELAQLSASELAAHPAIAAAVAQPRIGSEPLQERR